MGYQGKFSNEQIDEQQIIKNPCCDCKESGMSMTCLCEDRIHYLTEQPKRSISDVDKKEKHCLGQVSVLKNYYKRLEADSYVHEDLENDVQKIHGRVWKKRTSA